MRDWVQTNPHRGARELGRLAADAATPRSADEIADALIRLAGRTHFASSRAW